MVSDPKTRVDAQVSTKAHFAMAEADVRRTYGSLWNTTVVYGTVISVIVDTSGKRANAFLSVFCELPVGVRERRVNTRSVAFAGPVDPQLSNASTSLPHSLEIQTPESQPEVSFL